MNGFEALPLFLHLKACHFMAMVTLAFTYMAFVPRLCILQVALDLYRMHKNPFVGPLMHGDLKADNVLVFEDRGSDEPVHEEGHQEVDEQASGCAGGSVEPKPKRWVGRLSDYGLAAGAMKMAADGGPGHLLEHFPEYCYYRTAPPEVKDGGAYTLASDIYAFGCLIEEVFEGMTFPSDLIMVVEKCKEVDPAQRPTIGDIYVKRDLMGPYTDMEVYGVEEFIRKGQCYSSPMFPAAEMLPPKPHS